MSKPFPTAGLALVGALALSGAAMAHDTQTTSQADSMVVTRDAATGQLRAATAAEIAALKAGSSASKQGQQSLLPKRHASGAIGVRATDDMASYAVVSRRADGTLAEACVESRSAAEQAVQTGVLPARQLAER